MNAERIVEPKISPKIVLFPSEEREEIDRINSVYSKVRRARDEYLHARSLERVNLQNVFSENLAVWVAVRAGELEGYNVRLCLCKITPEDKGMVGLEIVFIQFPQTVDQENYGELLRKANLKEIPPAFLENFNGVFSVLKEEVKGVSQGLLRRRGTLVGCTQDPLILPTGNIFCQSMNPAVIFSRDKSVLPVGNLATNIEIDGRICPCDLEFDSTKPEQFRTFKEIFGANLSDERVLKIAVSPLRKI